VLRLVTIDLSAADKGTFDKYEAIVLPLLADHGGRLEWRVRSADGASETHLLFLPNGAAYEAFLTDPRRIAARPLWERSGATANSVEVEKR
jgi:hypothetical protein